LTAGFIGLWISQLPLHALVTNAFQRRPVPAQQEGKGRKPTLCLSRRLAEKEGINMQFACQNISAHQGILKIAELGLTSLDGLDWKANEWLETAK
jgi:hypothetical protein